MVAEKQIAKKEIVRRKVVATITAVYPDIIVF